jgi:hypothetical protein
MHTDSVTLGPALTVSFLRTLRIPDDGKTYPLPPGLGRFPIRRVDDYASKVPDEWREKGGIFVPMYQREAMWISFRGEHHKPRAVKVGLGKVCALTAERWRDGLSSDPQNYLVTPPQPWLDGIAVKKGIIRQFVAMPLGLGYTVEGQVTGEESVGGLQLQVFEPKKGRSPDQPVIHRMRAMGGMGCPPAACAPAAAMGLAAGGRMKQSIYKDPHGLDTWDLENSSRLFVHIVSSEAWREITGEEPPASPITASHYAAHGLPWFELYDECIPAIDGNKKLASLKSVKELDAEKSARSGGCLPDSSVTVGSVTKLWNALGQAVGIRDGKW